MIFSELVEFCEERSDYYSFTSILKNYMCWNFQMITVLQVLCNEEEEITCFYSINAGKTLSLKNHFNRTNEKNFFVLLAVDCWCSNTKTKVYDQGHDRFTLYPLYVQLPNFILQSWSSKGNHVISILQVDLNIPGGIYVQLPVLVTTTFVG